MIHKRFVVSERVFESPLLRQICFVCPQSKKRFKSLILKGFGALFILSFIIIRSVKQDKKVRKNTKMQVKCKSKIKLKNRPKERNDTILWAVDFYIFTLYVRALNFYNTHLQAVKRFAFSAISHTFFKYLPAHIQLPLSS